MSSPLAIVNPSAGGGHAQEEIENAIALVRRQLGQLDLAEIALPDGDAYALARRAVDEGRPIVVALGGDGTVGGAARALVGSEAILGVMPFGTFMNIARALGIPRDDPEAAAALIGGKVRAIDVGRVGGELFFEAAGIGLDAEAFHAAWAFKRGRTAYALSLIGALLRRRSGRVEALVDGKRRTLRVLQAVVSNAPYYGWGFEVAPHALIDDGLLDLTIFGDRRRTILREFIAAAIARDRAPHGRRHRGRSITLSSRGPLDVHADGRLVGRLPQTFECLPRALRVFAP